MACRILCPWDFPGKSAGVDCHFLLQGIFPTQELNPHPLHCRQTLYHLSQSKQQEKQKNKSSAQISPYRKLTQTTGPTLGEQKPKGRKNSTLKLGKGDLKHNK